MSITVVYAFLVLIVVADAATTFTKVEWKQCGTGSPVDLESIDISPMPIPVPGEINIKFDAVLAANFSESASLELTINQLRRFTSPRIPCIANVGSCKYKDICTLLDRMEKENWLWVSKDIALQIKSNFLQPLGIPATCPVAARSYSADFKLKLPEVPKLMSMFASGDYSIKASMVKDDGQELFCIEMKLSIEDKGKFLGIGK